MHSYRCESVIRLLFVVFDTNCRRYSFHRLASRLKVACYYQVSAISTVIKMSQVIQSIIADPSQCWVLKLDLMGGMFLC